MDENRWRVYLAIIGAIIISIMFLYSIFNPLPNSYTFGVLTEKHLIARGAASTVVYNIDGKDYEAYIGFYNNYPIGEKFICKYNKNWPNHARVDQTSPIFLREERIRWGKALITEVSVSAVFFIHIVREIEYKRWQSTSTKSELVEGDSVDVVYWFENPQRVIIPEIYDSRTRMIIENDININKMIK